MAEGDLWIIGAGSLGGRVGRKWRMRFPRARIIAETRSENRHRTLEACGFRPRRRDQALSEAERRAPYRLVAVPPSSLGVSPESEISRAFEAEGSFPPRVLLVSSTGVYDGVEAAALTEDTQPGRTERARHLTGIEDIALERGGRVLRLAGLYSRDRGPHRYYARQTRVDADPRSLVRLIHEDDAAELCVRALLRHDDEPRVFLGHDGHPLSREEMCRLSGIQCRFDGAPASKGATLDGRRTREVLRWQPRFSDFGEGIRHE